METVQLTDEFIGKLDAFQMNRLRKILGKQHTYWKKTATNESILREAAWIMSEQGKVKATGARKKKRAAENKTGTCTGSQESKEQIRAEQRTKHYQ
jgi:hypothetical protein